MCEKVEYGSFREAQAIVNAARKHRYVNGQRMNRLMGRKDKQLQRSYRCEECGYWHITSQPENSR